MAMVHQSFRRIRRKLLWKSFSMEKVVTCKKMQLTRQHVQEEDGGGAEMETPQRQSVSEFWSTRSNSY